MAALAGETLSMVDESAAQKGVHASLHAKPTPRNPNGTLFSSPWLPGYGKGILPPLIALD